MYYRVKCLIMVLLILPGVSLYAQNFMVDINLMLGNPRGEFEDNVDAVGFGGSVAGGYYLGQSPIMLGADFSYMIYGNESRTEPFSTTIPDVRVDVETSNNILQGHLLLRLQSNRGAFRPYLDGLAGFNYLFTQTKIENRGAFDEPIAESTNLDDTAFSYGVGGGVTLRVSKIKPDEEENPLREVLINFGVRYIFGGEAEYLQEGSIRRENGEVLFDVSQSTTDLLTFELGVVFGF